MKKILVFALAVALLGACANGNDDVAAPITTPGASPPQDCVTDAGATVPVEMQDNEFVAACIEMSADQGFSLRNQGENLHNFSIEGVPMVDVDTRPGDENNTEAANLDPGAYAFFCKYHQGQGMEGELRVTPASPDAPPPYDG